MNEGRNETNRPEYERPTQGTGDPGIPATPNPDTIEIVKRVLKADERNRARYRETFHRIATPETFERSSFRELGPADLPHIEKLYRTNEIDAGVFAQLAAGQWTEADERAQKGGYIDRWEPTAEELAALRRHQPDYIPSGEEFQNFLEGKHGRPGARFRAFGIFHSYENSVGGRIEGQHMRALIAAFVPDPHCGGSDRERYAAEIVRKLTGADASSRFVPQAPFVYGQQLQQEATTTAEWYMLGTDGSNKTTGAAAAAFHRMFEQLEEEGANITQWYLHRFSSFSLVSPHREDQRDARDSPNNASRKFCYDRGFRDCGNTVVSSHIAAREVERVGTVLVTPTWRTMWGRHAEVSQAGKALFTEIHEHELEWHGEDWGRREKLDGIG